MNRLGAAVVVVASVVVSMSVSGPAVSGEPRRIDVFRREGALARAVERARPGDVLRVHRRR